MRRSTERNYQFFTRCCDREPGLSDWQKGDAINEMSDRARPISYDTIRRHCKELPELERSLGYGVHLRIEQDRQVSFYKGHYRGARAYYIEHSRIEHIFVHQDDLRMLTPGASPGLKECSWAQSGLPIDGPCR
jgi:hypothetical protein